MDNVCDAAPKTQERGNENSVALLMHEDRDLEGILLEPEEEELAVLNPSLYQESEVGPNPFLHRTEVPDSVNRYSVIDFRWLESPTRLSKEKRTLIKPEYEYEKRGCEDPRLAKINDDYFITYVGFDGVNARVCLAITKDFRTVEKKHVIGPQIELKKAAEMTKDRYFKEKWDTEFKGLSERKKNTKFYLWDKDAFLDFNSKTGFWEMYHRIEPDIQLARTKYLEDFKKQEFWEENIRNIDKYTLIKKEWIPGAEKIGIGTIFNLGDKRAGLLHWVDKEMNYYGSFFEINDKGKVESIMTDPLLIPREEDAFNYSDEKKNKYTKKVVFPTATLLNHKIWIYYGSGDKKIKYRTTNKPWLYNELNEPSNRIEGIR